MNIRDGTEKKKNKDNGGYLPGYHGVCFAITKMIQALKKKSGLAADFENGYLPPVKLKNVNQRGECDNMTGKHEERTEPQLSAKNMEQRPLLDVLVILGAYQTRKRVEVNNSRTKPRQQPILATFTFSSCLLAAFFVNLAGLFVAFLLGPSFLSARRFEGTDKQTKTQSKNKLSISSCFRVFF